MSKMSKTARKSAAKMPQKHVSNELTPEQKIVTLRGLRAAKMFVCDMSQVDALLAAHDALRLSLADSRAELMKARTELALAMSYVSSGESASTDLTLTDLTQPNAVQSPLDHCGLCGWSAEKHTTDHPFVPNVIA